MNQTIRLSHSSKVTEFHKNIVNKLFSLENLNEEQNIAKQLVLWKHLSFEKCKNPNVYQIASAFSAARKTFAIINMDYNKEVVNECINNLNEKKWYNNIVEPMLPECLLRC